jgi:hypothetical protein
MNSTNSLLSRIDQEVLRFIFERNLNGESTTWYQGDREHDLESLIARHLTKKQVSIPEGESIVDDVLESLLERGLLWEINDGRVMTYGGSTSHRTSLLSLTVTPLGFQTCPTLHSFYYEVQNTRSTEHKEP